MSKNLKENTDFLKFLSKTSKTQRNQVIKSATSQQIKSLKECVLNICAGNVSLSPKQFVDLKKKRNKLYKFLKSKSLRDKKIVVQNGGFLPLVLSALTPVLASLAQSAIQKVISQ